MNIQSIKTRAKEVLLTNKDQYIKVIIIVSLLELIPTLFSSSNSTLSQLLYFIALIVLLPINQGIIVASLKMVRNNADAITDDDSLVGIKRFVELFPTYFLKELLIYGITLLVMIIPMIIVIATSYYTINSIINLINNPSEQVLISMMLDVGPKLAILILVMVVLLLVVSLILSALLLPVPYLIEQYKITGTKAISISIKMMKNHIMDYIKLFFSFFGWMVLAAVIEMVLGMFIELAIIPAIISTLVGVFTYVPQFTLSQTVLFEEISYYYFQEGESNETNETY